MLVLVLTTVLGMASTVEAGTTLPDDVRLEPVRAKLQQIVERSDAAGLPTEMIVSKVREGLAKGVDVTRIEVAATRLSENLATAQQYIAARRPGRPPAPLVRAVAQARLANVPLSAVDALVRGDGAERQRAVEVLTDLSLRGYPSERSSLLVQNVLTRDARSIDRLPGTLELIRQDYALSHTEAVDALARGLASADSLQTAYNRTVEDERRRGQGRGAAAKGGDEEGDGPGKSGMAPGQLKKKAAPPRRVPPVVH
jgi:hypothetical protein